MKIDQLYVERFGSRAGLCLAAAAKAGARITALLEDQDRVNLVIGAGFLTDEFWPVLRRYPVDWERVRLFEVKGLAAADVVCAGMEDDLAEILQGRYVYFLAPGLSVAAEVRDALLGPVVNSCAVSLLRMHAHAVLFLDEESAVFL